MTKKSTREQTRCTILKTLLSLGTASKQKLTNELPKEKKISRATVSSRVEELVAEGMIKKTIGPRGPRGTHNCALELKGVVYLLLKCSFSDEELKKTLRKLFENEEFKIFRNAINTPDYRATLSQAVTESIFKLRSKINLEFFDEKWALYLLYSFVEEAFWKLCEKVLIRTPQDFGKFLRRVGMKKADAIKLFSALLRDAKRAKKENEVKTAVYRKTLSLAKKIR